jgi:membrane-associated phospholipid phosphatase
MNNFDAVIQTLIARNAFTSPEINRVIGAVEGLYLAKGLLLVAALWWIWFQPSDRNRWQREMVVATVAAGLVALAVGRTLAYFLPFRLRPRFDPQLNLPFPVGAKVDAVLRTWSSFPSDHAMLWMAVAMGIFLVRRREGIAALAYTALIICAPRVYLGLHYPTDVIVGALLGISITYLLTRESIRPVIAGPVLQFVDRYPGPCYALAFIFLFELVTQFDEIRLIAQYITKAHGH